jgi:hypothetical protein
MIQFKALTLLTIAFVVTKIAGETSESQSNTQPITDEESDKLELKLTASAEVTDYLVGQIIEVEVRLR